MIKKTQFQEFCIPYGQMNIIFNLRTTWRDLATWTRAYLVSSYSGIGIKEAVGERMYQIPVAFGNVFRLVFGDEIADQYINMLSNHVIALQSLIDAQIRGDTQAVNENTMRLYQNADERAAFLAKINPYWDQTTWRNLFYTYLNRTLEQTTSFLTGDYDRNIDIFDRILAHTTIMGDYFSQGLFNYLTLRGTAFPTPVQNIPAPGQNVPAPVQNIQGA